MGLQLVTTAMNKVNIVLKLRWKGGKEGKKREERRKRCMYVTWQMCTTILVARMWGCHFSPIVPRTPLEGYPIPCSACSLCAECANSQAYTVLKGMDCCRGPPSYWGLCYSRPWVHVLSMQKSTSVHAEVPSAGVSGIYPSAQCTPSGILCREWSRPLPFPGVLPLPKLEILPNLESANKSIFWVCRGKIAASLRTSDFQLFSNIYGNSYTNVPSCIVTRSQIGNTH